MDGLKIIHNKRLHNVDMSDYVCLRRSYKMEVKQREDSFWSMVKKGNKSSGSAALGNTGIA